jgi:hypothetical protein
MKHDHCSRAIVHGLGSICLHNLLVQDERQARSAQRTTITIPIPVLLNKMHDDGQPFSSHRWCPKAALMSRSITSLSIKLLTVSLRPSVTVHDGDQPSTAFARPVSACLLGGSSSGMGLKTILLRRRPSKIERFPPVISTSTSSTTFTISSAQDKIVPSYGEPMFTGSVYSLFMRRIRPLRKSLISK